MTDPVWSKAETHCVWCGLPDVTEAEYERDHYEQHAYRFHTQRDLATR